MARDDILVDALSERITKVVLGGHPCGDHSPVGLLLASEEVLDVDVLGALVEDVVANEVERGLVVDEDERGLLERTHELRDELADEDALLDRAGEGDELRLGRREGDARLPLAAEGDDSATEGDGEAGDAEARGRLAGPVRIGPRRGEEEVEGLGGAEAVRVDEEVRLVRLVVGEAEVDGALEVTKEMP